MKKTLFIIIQLMFSSYSMALTGLEAGSKVPDLSLKDIAGKSIELAKLQKTTVLVFYRGSWCPYCIKQLKSIDKEVMPKLNLKTQQLIAISVDSVKVAKKMKRNNNFSFDLISDSNALSLTAFKIVNKLDANLVKTYKNSYKIDIEKDSGQTHHMIAHPAVFIIKAGRVLYSDVHADYKQRTSNSTILKELGDK